MLVCNIQLDFSIVKINGEELEKKFLEKGKKIYPINLNASTNIKNGDIIHIIQHPHGSALSMSTSTCKVLGKQFTYHCVCTVFVKDSIMHRSSAIVINKSLQRKLFLQYNHYYPMSSVKI